jgi:lipoprotein signal peptidase
MLKITWKEWAFIIVVFLALAHTGNVLNIPALEFSSPVVPPILVLLFRQYKRRRAPRDEAVDACREIARAYGLWAVAVVLILDQGTKFALLRFFDFASLKPSETVTLLPFLKLGMTWNPGFGSGLVTADVAIVIGLVAISALVLWLWFARNQTRATALGLITGGALGNFADWLFRGNVADVAITLGVVVLVLDWLLRVLPQRIGPAKEGS